MSWPEDPCPACPRGASGGCQAQALRNSRLCALAASGREDYRALLATPESHTTPAVPPKATPDIPLAGDVVEAIAKRIGADRLAKWWEAQTGQPCGCAERKAKLNRATRRLLRWAGLE
jgi:hypothetical protein